jgi:transcriptional regulator with XRE-family HTH domain
MVLGYVATEFRLAELLEESRLSQRELAGRAHVSPTTVNRMAANLTTRVDLETLDGLSRALTEALGRAIEPGDLIVRTSAKRSAQKTAGRARKRVA